MTLLDRIINNKKRELVILKKIKSFDRLRKAVVKLPKKNHCFFRALKKKKRFAVIAEIKKSSPSRGVLRKDFKPAAIAKSFERAGAAALSVLTDEKFFGGSAVIFKKVRGATKLPLLRKDFTLDIYQVYEARWIGADAVLLIAAILSREELTELSGTALELGLDVLFEVHTLNDIKKILPLKPQIVGINNRDLKTFHTNLGVTARLIKRLPRKTLAVSESGIQNARDLLRLKCLGVRAAL
ncbi:MAG: indole-3-glycerol phosphate synthase, partial [Candidatus Omnitrophica bacterium CG07_land_8_20_14_0_80_50_8]